MKKFLPALAVGAAAFALAITPAITASAAPAHVSVASAAEHYTLSIDGNGKHASVVWTTLTAPSSGTTSTPKLHTVAKAKEPWKKHVRAGADLYEVVAVQTTGSRLSCTIRNTHGTVVAHSMSRGRSTIVTCITTTNALLAGAGTGAVAG